jgi:hypothetical protein
LQPIEDLLCLDVHALTKGIVGSEVHVTQGFRYESGFHVSAQISLYAERGQVTLTYAWQGEPVVSEIALVRQEGGAYPRWLFVCPLEVNGKPCRHLAGRLYLARTKYFGCRFCQRLRYRSEGLKKADRLADSPAAFKKALRECKTILDKKTLIEAYLLRRRALEKRFRLK